jgi:SAP domain
MPNNPLEEFIEGLKQPVGNTGTLDELYMKEELTDDDWVRATQRLSEADLLQLRAYHEGKSYDRGQPPSEVVEAHNDQVEQIVSEAHDDPAPITPEVGDPAEPIAGDEAMGGDIDYNEWRVPQLQQELRDREMSPTGTKDELVTRLQQADARAAKA